MAKKPDVPRQIIEVAFRLAAEQGWRDLSLAEIAAAAKLPLSQVYPIFPSKRAILAGFSRMIDGQVVSDDLPELDEGSARERLFDVMMHRFDALVPYKAAIGNLLQDYVRDPVAALGSLPQLCGSMALMLEAAGLSANGLRGAVRVRGLTAVYLVALRVWLRDDSPDQAKTMASLDASLGRVERLARTLRGRS